MEGGTRIYSTRIANKSGKLRTTGPLYELVRAGPLGAQPHNGDWPDRWPESAKPAARQPFRRRKRSPTGGAKIKTPSAVGLRAATTTRRFMR